LKDKIHPKYFESTITCACGNVIHTRSTVKDIRVEICSACHPFFFTGKQKLIDTAGRVERFRRKYKSLEQKKEEQEVKEEKKEIESVEKQDSALRHTQTEGQDPTADK